jgi:4-hydroxy-tetrahydrodipicolinate reductase
MGRAIAHSIATQADLILASVWLRDARQAEGLELDAGVLASIDIDQVAAAADVVIDFSLPDATGAVLAASLSHGKALVCGVSGLAVGQIAAFDAAAGSIAIVYDRNMSAGVAVLENVVRLAAGVLGPEFAVEVHETHHIHKLDAPSGTALKLGEAIAAARGTDAAAIHYDVQRRGEVPGDHTVILSSASEKLTFGHSVTTRQVFADGALRAARWVARKPPGRYSMQDVLLTRL